MENNGHKVSIIIRTSERYIFLERAIQDVLQQTYKQWYIILVNDGGDISKINGIIQKYNVPAEKIRVINVASNQGLHKAINLGAKAVETEFVVMHDDDDTWHPNFLKETISYLEGDSGRMGVITHSYKVYESVIGDAIREKKRKPFNFEIKSVISMYDMLKNNLFSPISFVYRSCVYKEIGFFDETLQVLEDWEFNIRFLMKHDIHVIEKPLANYHIRVQNNINQVYKNTITSKKRMHQKYDTIIRNRYLREDLKNNELGIGALMNILRWNDGKVMKKLKKYLNR